MMSKKITRDDLIIWIDRSPSNSDLDLINYIIGLQESRLKAIEYIKNKWYSKNTRNIEELYSLGNWQIELLEILGGKE